jgi:class 3 adenylate cyclase
MIVENPETRYATTADDVHIAYQSVGDGPVDLVFVPGWAHNVEYVWEWPEHASFARRLGSFSRLILLDRRGTGLSDHILRGERRLTLEARMEDISTVMKAVRSHRAVLFGFEHGVMPCAMFAATYPERTVALIAHAPEGGRRTPETPWRPSDDKRAAYLKWVKREWGTIRFAREEGAGVWPTIEDDAEWWDHYARFMRRSVSPGDAAALLEIDYQTDVTSILPTIQVPVLVIVTAPNDLAESNFFAAQIPSAKLVEVPGDNHGYMSPDQDRLLDQIELFLRDLRNEEAELERVLATVLFTDIVGSTTKAADVGDRTWRDLLGRHHSIVRALLRRYGGREIDTVGDGFLAAFAGPARAIRCALQIVQAMVPLGIEIRAGLHTGEVETTIDGKIAGIAMHIGARIGAMARPSEVLVSQTVKDLVAGGGLSFEDRGEHELMGVPDHWRLYRVV